MVSFRDKWQVMVFRWISPSRATAFSSSVVPCECYNLIRSAVSPFPPHRWRGVFLHPVPSYTMLSFCPWGPGPHWATVAGEGLTAGVMDGTKGHQCAGCMRTIEIVLKVFSRDAKGGECLPGCWEWTFEISGLNGKYVSMENNTPVWATSPCCALLFWYWWGKWSLRSQCRYQRLS